MVLKVQGVLVTRKIVIEMIHQKLSCSVFKTILRYLIEICLKAILF
jgi:hypothetical protein